MNDKSIVDFVCVGFPKCGTTTLYSVLGQHPEISLAKDKETSFFDWCDEFMYPLNILTKRFYNIKAKKHALRGMIESEFFMKASDMKFYFGKDVKIIFMLRNPVERLYSAFKMRLRQGRGNIVSLYKENKKLSTVQLFSLFCEEGIIRKNRKYLEELYIGDYYRWIQEFEHEFSSDNFLIIFLEDYKRDALHEIRKIEKFLGVAERCQPIAHIINEGNLVSKNYYCSRLNGIFNNFYKQHNGLFIQYPNLCNWWIDTRDKVYSKSLREETAHMDSRTKQMCEKYYKNSKEKLEIYIGRNLENIWF